MNKHRLIFVLGGARSGKSTFAQKLAMMQGEKVLFVATAEACDEEMAARIARHRGERPAQWTTVEERLAIAQALDKAAPAPVVILDCVTLWVSNLLLMPDTSWEKASSELDALLDWHRSNPSDLIVVSNEVGMGIVPGDQVSRTYRDWLGAFNQRLASMADQVYLMVAGLPVEVKKLVRILKEGDTV